MLLSETFSKLLGAAVIAAGSTLAVTSGVLDNLSALHAHGVFTLHETQSKFDAQTLRAARIGFELSGGHPDASEAELVKAGWLTPDWLTREAVDLTPIQLPEVPDEAQ